MREGEREREKKGENNNVITAENISTWLRAWLTNHIDSLLLLTSHTHFKKRDKRELNIKQCFTSPMKSQAVVNLLIT